MFQKEKNVSVLSNIVPFIVDLPIFQMPSELLYSCTALLFRDTKAGVYAGRTMELSMELPYMVAIIPQGHEFTSVVDGHAPLVFKSKHAIFGIVIPNGSVTDLKVVEGINEKGLTFSVLAYAGASGPIDNAAKTKAILAAIDLGAYVLGQFDNAKDVKTDLDKNPAILTALASLHGAKTPFHFVVHDNQGNSIVIEYANGQQSVYVNPVGVMTNGPEFSWHLTNLNNYTFLSNMDQSTAKFGDLDVVQPDSGIATAGLPSSNTSVGRFVRAAYYATFTEKPEPETAIKTLAHVMNLFDRPRGATIDPPESGGLDIEGVSATDGRGYKTEYTSWTVLADLNNGEFYIRTYSGLNYIKFDLKRLFATTELKIAPLGKVSSMDTVDVTDTLLK